MTKLDEGQAIACSLNDADFRARRALARQEILPKIKSSRRVENGVTATFDASPSIRKDVESFVTLERQCCEFLTFSFSSDGTVGDDIFELTVSGPPEAAKTVEMFVRAIEKGAP